MSHYFDPDVAVDVGVNAAILYENIRGWCEHNRANGKHEHDGLFWTYNSMAAFADLFPYLSNKQVRQALKLLEDKGYIKSGNYNKVAYDRTKWYADLRCGKVTLQSDIREDSICPTGQMDLTPEANGFDLEGKPIPNINTSLNSSINIEKESIKKESRFIPPTIDEVRAYCEERNNNVDPERFFSYYEAGNWKDGKGKPVKNWKQKIITWERQEQKKPAMSYGNGNALPFDDFL